MPSCGRSAVPEASRGRAQRSPGVQGGAAHAGRVVGGGAGAVWREPADAKAVSVEVAVAQVEGQAAVVAPLPRVVALLDDGPAGPHHHVCHGDGRPDVGHQPVGGTGGGEGGGARGQAQGGARREVAYRPGWLRETREPRPASGLHITAASTQLLQHESSRLTGTLCPRRLPPLWPLQAAAAMCLATRSGTVDASYMAHLTGPRGAPSCPADAFGGKTQGQAARQRQAQSSALFGDHLWKRVA